MYAIATVHMALSAANVIIFVQATFVENTAIRRGDFVEIFNALGLLNVSSVIRSCV